MWFHFIHFICPFVEQVIARVIAEYYSKSQKNHALLNRVTNATTPAEQAALEEISKKMKITATLLPIRSVGVQGMCTYPFMWNCFPKEIKFNNVVPRTYTGDSRSYSYVLGLSTEETPDWKDMLFLAKLIPRILHNINRVCYIFGGPVQFPINDITETKISKYSLGQLRQADHLANSVSIARQIWVISIGLTTYFIIIYRFYTRAIVCQKFHKCLWC